MRMHNFMAVLRLGVVPQMTFQETTLFPNQVSVTLELK